ncbi:MAG: alpha-galactosidase [Thermomicrobiales bacterium]
MTELARSTSAYINEDQNTWVIGNDQVEIVLTWTGDRLTFQSLGEWKGSANDPAWKLNWNGIALANAPVVVSASNDADSVTLSLTARSENHLSVTLNLQCWSGLPIVEQWLEIEALESGLLRDVFPSWIAVNSPQPLTMQTISGVQRQGGYSPDPGDFRSFRREEQLLDGAVTLLSDERSTWSEMPWVAVSDGQGHGLFTGLRYSAQWRIEANGDRAAKTSTLGVRPDFLEVALKAGDRWISPRTFTGVFDGDLDSAGRVMHDYQREILSPKLPADFPWVQYNTWFSYLTEYTAEILEREVDIAAELGMDIFYVDAGWWVGNIINDWHFSSGLGNWTENREKFPQGIADFAAYVRNKGLRFGIWVEPERVDLRTVTTGTWNEEWLVRHDGNYSGPDWPQDTETAWLCFGHPDVQEWAIDWVGRLVEELDVSWLKWDSNWWQVCNATDHGHGPSDGEMVQVAGVHRVMDALRARFPDLIIENCAGGGTRMDFEMAAHSHVTWVSDASEPAARVRFQGEGASYLFVPATLNSWVTESRRENLNRRDLPESALTAIVRSRMLGALGFSCRMVEWGEPTKEIIAACIAEYKSFRHLLRDGYVGHLLPQQVLDSPKFPSPFTWGATLFYAKDRSEGIVLAFRNRSPESTIALSITQLDANATYRISGDGIESKDCSGTDLGTGIVVSAPILGSALVRFERLG